MKISETYPPYSDINTQEEVEALRSYLKELGYSHFTNERCNIHAINMKRGVQVDFKFDRCTAYDSEADRPLQSIEIHRREAKQWSKTKTHYVQACAFLRPSPNSDNWELIAINKIWPAETNLNWEQVISKLTEILTTLTGDPTVPKDKVDDILQNLILADLKQKLAAAHVTATFERKATKGDEKSSLVIRHKNQYQPVVIRLKSGFLGIYFGQEHGSPERSVKLPPFEDPHFNPEPLVELVLNAVAHMQRLKTLRDNFETERERTYDAIKQEFQEGMLES